MAGLTQYQNTGSSQFTTGLLVIVQSYNLPEKGGLHSHDYFGCLATWPRL